MNCTVVQRVSAIGDTQEASCLLEGFLAHARHLEQFAAVLECSIFGTVIDDVLGESWSESRDIGEQMLRCCVDVHTYFIDA